MCLTTLYLQKTMQCKQNFIMFSIARHIDSVRRVGWGSRIPPNHQSLDKLIMKEMRLYIARIIIKISWLILNEVNRNGLWQYAIKFTPGNILLRQHSPMALINVHYFLNCTTKVNEGFIETSTVPLQTQPVNSALYVHANNNISCRSVRLFDDAIEMLFR